jgi:hypothetical protein
MIFGFNTDIKVENTVYHVQSEARAAEKLLQTQVFVKGHCIGKRAVSYSQEEIDGQTEQNRHDLLREQHRSVVQAIRDGRLDKLIEDATTKLAANARPLPPDTTPAAPTPPLELKFIGSSRPSQDSMLIRFGVAQGPLAVEGALMMAQIMPDSKASETFSGGTATQAKTDHEGFVEVTLPIPPNAQGEASLVVQVNYAGASVAKKFRIKAH